VLATRAAVAARLYHRAFERVAVEVLAPDAAGQDVVNRAIYGVKAGQMGADITRGLAQVAQRLITAGGQAVVLGCTELPYVLRAQDVSVPLLDSNLILARAAVRAAREAEVLSQR